MSALTFEVEDLSADHAVRPCRTAHFRNDGDERLRSCALLAQHNLESERQQGISRKHRDSIAKNPVIRRLSSSIIVVVHCRQIIVN